MTKTPCPRCGVAVVQFGSRSYERHHCPHGNECQLKPHAHFRAIRPHVECIECAAVPATWTWPEEAGRTLTP